MEEKEENSYNELVKDMNPLSYKDVAEDWEKNLEEWYHALITRVSQKTQKSPDKVAHGKPGSFWHKYRP